MESVFVNQGGDEIELRPITARQYLSARLEAEKLLGEAENDDVARAVLLGAALLVRGAFDDGRQAFPTVGDVLDSLTAQEIVETAVYIDITPEVRDSAADMVRRSIVTEAGSEDETERPESIEQAEDKPVKKIGEPETDGQAKTERKITEPETDSQVKTDRKITEPEADGQAKTDRKVTEQEGESRIISVRHRVNWYDSAETYSGGEFIGGGETLRYLPVRDAMRRVSDFFQRDSRRYDGGISQY